MSSNFNERTFVPVPGGRYDENGFYITPNGSFWDPDGVYFNREGIDRHGGFYDENVEYHPGPGWIEELLCYEDEKHKFLQMKPRQRKNNRNFEDDDDLFDENDDMDDLFENVDYQKLMNEEEIKRFKPSSQPTQIEINSQKKLESISPEKLFNEIPEEKKPTVSQPKRTETHIEVDALFK